MTFFSRISRLFPLVGFLGVCACSSMDDSGLYGYEEEFIIPDPDMVPVMPDDKPGQTVDEMLALPSPSITVKKAVYASVPETDRDYQQVGRFGSKEKISLRKGLNIPETGIVYGPSKRRNAEEVRALEIKKQEKDEVQVVSEEEILAQIIAPKTTEVKMIEVVPALPDAEPAKTEAVKEEPPVTETVETTTAKEQSPVLVVEPFEKTPAVSLTVVPPVKEEPAEKIALREIQNIPLPESGDQTKPVETAKPVETEGREEIVLIPPAKFEKIDREEEPVVLIPPQKKKKIKKTLSLREDMIVLIPPEFETLPSVEIFLDE